MNAYDACAISKEKRQGTAALQNLAECLWAFPRETLREKPELILFVVLIAIFNLPVLFGTVWRSMVFQPDGVRSGEWWQLFTHPFVHLTWYHLLLDGTAFLSLYCSLIERKILRRIGYVVAAAAGSLIVSCAA